MNAQPNPQSPGWENTADDLLLGGEELRLEQIRQKARSHAKSSGTYGQRAHFEPGKTISPFSLECERRLFRR